MWAAFVAHRPAGRRIGGALSPGAEQSVDENARDVVGVAIVRDEYRDCGLSFRYDDQSAGVAGDSPEVTLAGPEVGKRCDLGAESVAFWAGGRHLLDCVGREQPRAVEFIAPARHRRRVCRDPAC